MAGLGPLPFGSARRTVSQIRDALAAIYGPLPLAEVAGYLDDLARIGVLTVDAANR